MAEVISGYTCGQCDEFYESGFEAEECCQPEIWSAYQCSECGYVWQTITVAERCCPDYYDEPNEHENDCSD